MPINKETIISVFDDKLTLMQWLKTINKALEDAVLTGVEITKKGNATLSFKFTFEDGTYLESNDLVLQQGESVNGAYIQNGHLYLTLTNGTNLDAGNVKPVSNFSIDANQHLIVNYADGTSQDLGPIFNGNVNIGGNLTANSIIENMTGYSFTHPNNSSEVDLSLDYAGVVKNGNKITFAIAGSFTLTANPELIYFGTFKMPAVVWNKLYTHQLGPLSNALAEINVCCGSHLSSFATLPIVVFKQGDQYSPQISIRRNAPMTNTNIVANVTYNFRIEVTFLLSDNLAL